MKLNELQQGDRIMIEACMEHRSIECPTTIAQQLPNGAILNAVRVDGKVLNFDVEGVIINLIYTTGETAPDMWRGVTLSVTEIKGKKFYECLLERESVRVNRRGAYRVSVSDPGVIHLSSEKQGFRISMRDISETGFSFYLDEDAKVEINQKEHLELTFDTGEYRFNLDGYVVRTKDRLVCCRMGMINPMVSKFVVDKQREKLMMNKRLWKRNHMGKKEDD